jgi:hypothetical protein
MKKTKKDNGLMRPSTFFLIALIIGILLEPFLPDLGLLIAIVISFFIASRKNVLKRMDKWDFLLILLYVIITTFLLIYLQLINITKIPWWQILLVGIATDVVASLLGTIPIVGDIISGIINSFIQFLIIGGLAGLMMSITVVSISLLPGPSLGFNTFILIVIKLLSKTITGG